MSGLRFDGRVVVVTGGGRGLGRAYAELIGGLGGKVLVNDLGGSITGDAVIADPAEETAAAIRAAGGAALANRDTVATPDGGEAIVAAALAEWGRVDALIHNAGNVRYGAIDEVSIEDFRAVLDVHMMGAFHVVRAAFPHMRAANYGRIVLTSSIGGMYGNARVVNYGMAKASMRGLANVAALEGEAHGIKANVVMPSAVTRMADGLDTSRYPPLGPELVAPAVGWLAHERCTLSGDILAALGGRVARVYVAETEGAWQPSWSIDEVDARIGDICDKGTQHDFGLDGYARHLGHSFAMARRGGG